MAERDIFWVNTGFAEDLAGEFRAIKDHLGIRTNGEVVRHLVHRFYREHLNQRTALVDTRAPYYPATRVGVCPSCGAETGFGFVGMQEDPAGALIDLWNCLSCGSTISGNRINGAAPAAEAVR